MLLFTELFLGILHKFVLLLLFTQGSEFVIDIGKVPHEASRSVVANLAKLQQWAITSI